MKQPRSILAAALAAATIASLSLSSVTLAAGWGDPVTIWEGNADNYGVYSSWPVGLVSTGGLNLVAAYNESTAATNAVDLYVTRSTDGGATWLPRVRVSRPGSATRQSWARTISSYGTAVDAAWLEDSSARGIRYSRSLDGGATFSPSISLSNGSGSYPDVAHGPNGLVVVGWYTWTKGKVFVRVSHDGGATFDTKRALWNGLAGTNPIFSIAVGDGTIYAGLGVPGTGVVMRRSLDGVSWTQPTTLTKAGPGSLGFQFAAEGQQVYLGYAKSTATGSTLWSRRSTNGGATWSAGVIVGPDVRALDGPVMRLDGGVIRVIYGHCNTTVNPCTTQVDYQQSSNGTSWTTPEEVSTTPGHYATPMGVAHGDHTFVAYRYWAPVHWGGDIQVRANSD